MSNDTKSTRRRWIPWVALLATLLLIEGLSYLALFVLERQAQIKYEPNVRALTALQKWHLNRFIEAGQGEKIEQDPVLGWSPRVNTTSINSAGARDDREYDAVPPPGKIRIAAYGDSFTYGSDGELPETFEKQLSALDPNLEVLNYGVGAYGMDQAYLRYRLLGTEYHPDIVFIGFMSENIARHVNVFRPFYSRAYDTSIFTKPRFRVEDDELVLLSNPIATLEDHRRLAEDRATIAELGANDHHYQQGYSAGPFDVLATVRLAKIFAFRLRRAVRDPIFERNGMYNVRSEAYEITAKLFDEFHQNVIDNGALPIIVIFPDLNDQYRSRKGEQRRYAPLLDHFRRQGYEYIDALSAFEPYEKRYTVGHLTRPPWGHYSRLGNELVARYMLEWLKARGYTNREAIAEATRRVNAAGGEAAAES